MGSNEETKKKHIGTKNHKKNATHIFLLLLNTHETQTNKTQAIVSNNNFARKKKKTGITWLVE